MEGLIIKILNDKCFVKIDREVIICTIRGKFRLQRLLPLVGDKVIINKEKKVIEEILPRKNEIKRPPVSNITQALVVTSFVKPEFSTNLIDKLLVELETNNIKPIICLTKLDLIKDDINKYKDILNYYKKIGYKIYRNDNLDELKEIFRNEITVFIGQTGSGKSTLLNLLNPDLGLKTGEVSDALGRGRHTTRHIEIIEMYDGMVLDTPGFSALEFDDLLKEEVRDAFIEFKDFPCLYHDCMHIDEAECKVKKAVNEGKIMSFRYENYLKLQESALKRRDEYKRK